MKIVLTSLLLICTWSYANSANSATTTMAPPDNSLSLQTYNVTDGKGNVCLKMTARIQLMIKYVNTSKIMSDWITVNLTSRSMTAASFSSCNSPGKPHSYQMLTIAIDSGLSSPEDWLLVLGFTNDTAITTQANGQYFSLYSISFSGMLQDYPKKFPNPANTSAVVHMKNMTSSKAGFLTSVMTKGSLFCKSGFTDMIDPKFKVKITNVQLEAFQSVAPSSSFQTPFQLCPKDQRATDLVPIIVGGCLAGLVLIVTIGYLIGSARKKPVKVDVDANGYPEGEKQMATSPAPATPEKVEKL